jgi:hypothetical protein
MRRKSQFTIGAILGLVALLGCCFVVVRWYHTPIVVAQNPVVDVGQVAKGTTQQATFRFKNRGRRNVRIAPHASPCPGTFVDREVVTISPGDIGAISVALRFRTSSPNEDVRMPFRLATDDPASPWIEVTVVGRPK